MVYRLDFDRYPGTLLITCEGSASFVGFLSYMQGLQEEPRMGGVSSILVDMRSLTVRDLKTSEVEAIAREQAQLVRVGSYPNIKRSAMVVSDNLAFGLTRQFVNVSSTLEGPLRMVFRDMDSAMEWLEIE